MALSELPQIRAPSAVHNGAKNVLILHQIANYALFTPFVRRFFPPDVVG